MMSKKVVDFVKNKKKVVIAVLAIVMLFIVCISITVYAQYNGSIEKIADEKTLVRIAATLSKGESSSNKVEISSLKTYLNKYSGAGATTVKQKTSQIILVTFQETSNEYEIDVDKGPIFEDIEGVLPYIPNGYTQVEGTDLNTGFVIEDGLGNQYVWVEVPQTVDVYPTAGLNITSYSSSDYEKIENDLRDYTSIYGNGTSTDTWSSEETTGLTKDEYNTKKKKMLKSIYKNGGFYIGRYEAGSQTIRESVDDGLTMPIIKQNQYPYNWITGSKAQNLAMKFQTEGYQANLMFGVQWDLVLKYLETKGTTQAELNKGSTSWGNYLDNLWTITNENSKYSVYSEEEGKLGDWVSQAYGNKTSVSKILLTTGASDAFCRQNIYDIAGNVWEWTLENSNISGTPGHFRGGSASDGNSMTACYRWNASNTATYDNQGFRVSLYKDEGTGPDGGSKETPTYISEGYTQVIGTDLDTGFVIQDESGNEYVWVEVPRTTSVYSTAGLNIVKFTDAEYTKIENDLHTYTSAYRNNSYGDRWSSEEATGLIENEYNTRKKKMLKSIYKNGGFYIGRYETGTETLRESSSNALTTPVIKQNVYPYNNVTNKQAQELSETFAEEGYLSGLMFGVQWDLILKYLETKGTTQAELITDSTDWGNYKNNLYTITNTSAEYSVIDTSTDLLTEWLPTISYSKASGVVAILTTGASDAFAKQNIYDIAGNTWEWTLEKNLSYEGHSSIICGGNCYNNGYDFPANGAGLLGGVSETGQSVGFRVSLYKDEGTGSDAIEDQPYIPEGFTRVAGTDLGTGYVVRDPSGNEYVWVEVPRTTSVYSTAGTELTTFTSDELAAIENDLHTYTSTYREYTGFTDTWSSEDAQGLTETEYYNLKNKMLKSVYQNGGFYVGKYEAGISNSYREYELSEEQFYTEHPITETAVVKKNAYPYNWVRCNQAQSLASGMESGNYTSSLMFGIQWDLVLKYLETKGTTTAELNEDSTNWGNYANSEYTITNTSAKYNAYNLDTELFEGWLPVTTYSKASGNLTILSTGASETFSKMGIYDLAGNMAEWTLEYTSDSSYPCALRGGVYDGDGNDFPASDRSGSNATVSYPDVGFRPSIF